MTDPSSIIEIKIPDYHISYAMYGAWCERLGHERWNLVYSPLLILRGNKGMYVSIARLPPELAVLFRLEFGL